MAQAGPCILGKRASIVRTGLSILSYNVLIPNSLDGWWVYKTYSYRATQTHSEDITSWSHRQMLLRRDIAEADADIVCLQEVSAMSFESDFSFMKVRSTTQ